MFHRGFSVAAVRMILDVFPERAEDGHKTGVPGEGNTDVPSDFTRMCIEGW